MVPTVVVAAPDAQYVPAATSREHGKHASAEDDATRGLYEPSAQSEHAAEPAGATLPAGHATGGAAAPLQA